MMLGHLEQAEGASSSSLELSERLDHKPSISHSRMFRAEFCIILNRARAAAPHLRMSISIAKNYIGHFRFAIVMSQQFRLSFGDIREAACTKRSRSADKVASDADDSAAINS